MIRNTLLLVSVLFLPLLLGGCQLANQMQGIVNTQFSMAAEPTDGPRARLRVVATSGIVKAIPNLDCVDLHARGTGTVVATGPLANKGYRGRSLGMPSSSSSGETGEVTAEMYVSADRPVTLLYTGETAAGAGYGRVFQCVVALTFRPKAGMDYEALFLPGSQCVSAIHTLEPVRERVDQPASTTCKKT